MRKFVAVFPGLISLVFSFMSVYGQCFTESEKLISPHPGVAVLWGNALATDGEYLFVGNSENHLDSTNQNYLARAGAVDVFKKDNQGNWGHIQKITPFDRGEGDKFGSAIAFDGTTCVIGAPRDTTHIDSITIFRGSFYVYELNQMSGQFRMKQKIVASECAVSGLGSSVGLGGGWLLAGAPGYEQYDSAGQRTYQAGAVFAYQKNAQGDWEEKQIITWQRLTVNGSPGIRSMGESIDVTEDGYMITGDSHASGRNATTGIYPSNAGAALIYHYNQGVGEWELVGEMKHGDCETNEKMGTSVAIDRVGPYRYAVAGVPYKNDGSRDEVGAVYMFMEQPWNGEWVYLDKLLAPDSGAESLFGQSVDTRGDTLLITAMEERKDTMQGNHVTGAGAAYIFKFDGFTTWAFEQKLIVSDRDEDDNLGRDCQLLDSSIVISAPGDWQDAGAVYWFDECSLVGMQESLQESTLQIWPNPVRELLWVQHDLLSAGLINFEVVNAEGRMMVRGETVGEELRIDTQEFPNGLYIIRLWGEKSGKKMLTKKFLKY